MALSAGGSWRRHLVVRSSSPWQKGTVENINGRVRRWLPCDVDPKTLTTRQIIGICHELDAASRKCLGYRTPAQVFREKLMTEADTLP